jgi:hypothetical protein
MHIVSVYVPATLENDRAVEVEEQIERANEGPWDDTEEIGREVCYRIRCVSKMAAVNLSSTLQESLPMFEVRLECESVESCSDGG